MNLYQIFLRRDPEYEQAMLRLLIIGLVLVMLAASGTLGQRPEVTLGLIAFFAYTVLLFAVILIWPAIVAPRRVAGMVGDVAMTTWWIFLSDQTGVMLVWVYFFIIFGNLLRYGRAYGSACHALCVVAFVVVMVTAPWWRANLTVGFAMLMGLMMVPFYVSHLVRRIQQKTAAG